jgi:hypothetical protein
MMGTTTKPKPYIEVLGVGLKWSYSVALMDMNLCIPESNCKAKSMSFKITIYSNRSSQDFNLNVYLNILRMERNIMANK